jgi:hypothetical protein
LGPMSGREYFKVAADYALEDLKSKGAARLE